VAHSESQGTEAESTEDTVVEVGLAGERGVCSLPLGTFRIKHPENARLYSKNKHNEAPKEQRWEEQGKEGPGEGPKRKM
jgi:hypothetical protein